LDLRLPWSQKEGRAGKMSLARVFACTLLGGLLLARAAYSLHDGGASSTPAPVATVNQVTHDGLVKSAVFSDGSSLYISEEKDGHQVISKIVPSTGEQSTISTPFSDVRALDVSPDHASLLASPAHAGVRNHELWSIPLGQIQSARLADLSVDDAAWSPDGEELVFVQGTKICKASSKGTNVRKLVTVKGRPFSPRFSPDGKRIRFSLSDVETNTTSLWEMANDGSHLHQMLTRWNNARNVCCGVWSADGHSYIFQATQNSPTTVTTLWVLSDKGNQSEPTQLTDGPMSFGNPWPSNESNKIWALGVQPTGEAVKYDERKGEFSKILSGISATDVEYSSDGQWVTYVAVPDGTLWRSRADGSQRLQLTFAPERAALPRWSPKQKDIAYVSIRTGQPSQILLISINGGKASPVFAENRGQIDANWSADGKKMMFGYVHGTSNLSISLLDLTTHTISTIPGSEGLFSPRWSPDGRYVVALSPDFTKVMLFDFQTQKWSTWLDEPAGAVSYPIWSADSKYLYFDDLVTDEESIRRVKIGEDHTERVFGIHGIDRYVGPFGLWAGRSSDGSWMFVRDRSTQEVYSLNLGLSK